MKYYFFLENCWTLINHVIPHLDIDIIAIIDRRVEFSEEHRLESAGKLELKLSHLHVEQGEALVVEKRVYENAAFGLGLQSYEYAEGAVLDYELLADVRLSVERRVLTAREVPAVVTVTAVALENCSSFFLFFILIICWNSLFGVAKA